MPRSSNVGTAGGGGGGGGVAAASRVPLKTLQRRGDGHAADKATTDRGLPLDERLTRTMTTKTTGGSGGGYYVVDNGQKGWQSPGASRGLADRILADADRSIVAQRKAEERRTASATSTPTRQPSTVPRGGRNFPLRAHGSNGNSNDNDGTQLSSSRRRGQRSPVSSRSQSPSPGVRGRLGGASRSVSRDRSSNDEDEENGPAAYGYTTFDPLAAAAKSTLGKHREAGGRRQFQQQQQHRESRTTHHHHQNQQQRPRRGGEVGIPMTPPSWTTVASRARDDEIAAQLEARGRSSRSSSPAFRPAWREAGIATPPSSLSLIHI